MRGQIAWIVMCSGILSVAGLVTAIVGVIACDPCIGIGSAFLVIGLPAMLVFKPEKEAVRPVLMFSRRKFEGKPVDAKGVTGGRGPGGFPDIFGRTAPRAGAERNTTLVALTLSLTADVAGGKPDGIQRQ